MRNNGEPWWETLRAATLEAVWDIGELRCGSDGEEEEEEDVALEKEGPTDRTWPEG